MIGYIKGNLLNAADGVVLLENNGMGYEITCSASVYAKILSANGGEVYTFTSVKDDGISLYGFENIEEKNMFLKLISVSGVGPKMGIAVLSNMNLHDLAVKIATSDVKGLSAVKGLGKKTAERIILELRERVGETVINVQTGEVCAPDSSALSQEDEDAVIALSSLGFTHAECVAALGKAKAAGVTGLEKLIAFAIKNIK